MFIVGISYNEKRVKRYIVHDEKTSITSSIGVYDRVSDLHNDIRKSKKLNMLLKKYPIRDENGILGNKYTVFFDGEVYKGIDILGKAVNLTLEDIRFYNNLGLLTNVYITESGNIKSYYGKYKVNSTSKKAIKEKPSPKWVKLGDKENNIMWKVVFIKKGDPYGRGGYLAELPMVELYSVKKGRPDYFHCRYAASTLMDLEGGLLVDMGANVSMSATVVQILKQEMIARGLLSVKTRGL